MKLTACVPLLLIGCALKGLNFSFASIFKELFQRSHILAKNSLILQYDLKQTREQHVPIVPSSGYFWNKVILDFAVFLK